MPEGRSQAAELADLFERVAAHGNETVYRVWSAILQAPPYSAEFYSALALVAADLDQVESDIRASRLKEKTKELGLAAIESLRPYITFPTMLNESSTHVAERVEAIHRLHMLDDILEPLDARDIDQVSVEELMADLQEVFDSLANAGIDERLKAFLKAQIGHLMWALAAFPVVGIDGLTKAWGATTAEMMRSRGMRGAHEPQAQAWYTRAFKVAGKIGKAVIFAGAVVGGADNLLSQGDHLMGILGNEESAAAESASNQSVGRADNDAGVAE